VDRSRHPELYACDWMEQIGSYLKHGLFDADVLLDVTSTSINRLWNQLAPAIERMRVTRGDTLYEISSIGQPPAVGAKAHPREAILKKCPHARPERRRNRSRNGLSASDLWRRLTSVPNYQRSRPGLRLLRRKSSLAWSEMPRSLQHPGIEPLCIPFIIFAHGGGLRRDRYRAGCGGELRR
jgi:hypothetical protein